MAWQVVHILQDKRGWAVRTGVSGAASSVHQTQREAVKAGEALIRSHGGGELVVHRAAAATSRAPQREGQRTALRVPTELLETADRLAAELRVSRNDALLRLATRGAELYERQAAIAERRDARRSAIFADADAATSDLPSVEAMRAAVLAERGGPQPG